MKPIRFSGAGKELSSPQLPKDLQEIKLRPSDLDTFPIGWNATPQWDPSSLINFLKLSGYKPCKRYLYADVSFTITNESIRWHNDDGAGLMLCWLLFNTDSEREYTAHCSYPPELITRYGATEMKVGDICIFNADRGHAWLANGVSIMLTATISKIKPAKSICNKI